MRGYSYQTLDYIKQEFTLRDLMAFCGLSRADTGKLLGKSERTIQRWEKKPPEQALTILTILTIKAGYLEAIDPKWRGYRIIKDRLYTPDGGWITPGDITAMPYQRALIRSYQAEDRKRKERDQNKKTVIEFRSQTK